MTDNRTYATLNHPLEDLILLRMESLRTEPLTKAGESVLLWHPDPITNGHLITDVETLVSGEGGLSALAREIAWSYDNDTYTDWAPVAPTTLQAISIEPGVNIWLRVRLSYTGAPGANIYAKGAVVYGTRQFRADAEGVISLDTDDAYILRPADSYKVFKLTGFNVYIKNVPTGTTVDGRFRYSGDNGRTWMPWVPLTTANLVATRFNPVRFSKFEFAFAKTGPGTPVIYDLELLGDFQNVTCGSKTSAVLGLKTQCAVDGAACRPGEVPGTQNIMNWKPSDSGDCTRGSYNPYALNNQKAQYVYVGNAIARQLGQPTDYYRTDPDVNGTDFTLHEHQLYNIVDQKTVKVVVPENVFPDGQLKYSHFDLSQLEQFEVQITKEAFKLAFGETTRPGKNDAIYFCDMNLLFQVERVVPHRGPFNTELYYRLMLGKYSQKANVNGSTATTDVQDKLQGLLNNTTFASLFGPDEQDDQEKIAKQQQFTPLSKIAGVTPSDQVVIKAESILNSTLVVANSVYMIPVPMLRETVAVSYGHVDSTLDLGDNRALSFWFKLDKYNTDWTVNFFSNRESVLGYDLTLNDGIFNFNLNTQSFTMDASDVQPNIWYCMLVNVDQRQQQLEMSLYARQNEAVPHRNKTPELTMVAGAMHALQPVQFTHQAIAHIGGIAQKARARTNYYMTNIRLYKQVVQAEQRDRVLNAHVVNDADLLILADNGDAKMSLPTMGNFGD